MSAVTSTSRATGPDRWQHYGASSRGRRSPSRLHWDWYQRIGPGAELLGDLTGRTVAELGAGASYQAAYVAAELKAARVIAIDSSTAQHSRGRALYEDVPGLDFVHEDAAAYLRDHPSSLDVVYSIFGALDFSHRGNLPVLPCLSGMRRGKVRLTASRNVLVVLQHIFEGGISCQPSVLLCVLFVVQKGRKVFCLRAWRRRCALLGLTSYEERIGGRSS
ncbi:methyltransferase domain-containing protein [Streptomyces arboris]|uniref:methyltransferase domain-containing protein n=1 Tax=Streptomyces arboris TaxID=2600619 RepID=UPI001CEF704E|nr:class I SAM-dependent methyltransferase [Streptomyces arboris]